MGKLYLAKFSPDGEWQRAAPRTPNRDPDGKVIVYFIGFNNRNNLVMDEIRFFFYAYE